MAVVGRSPGTGVPAIRNVRTDQTNSATATTTAGAPMPIVSVGEPSRSGHAKCSNTPSAIALRYTSGGLTIPRLATSGNVALCGTAREFAGHHSFQGSAGALAREHASRACADSLTCGKGSLAL